MQIPPKCITGSFKFNMTFDNPYQTLHVWDEFKGDLHAEKQNNVCGIPLNVYQTLNLSMPSCPEKG